MGNLKHPYSRWLCLQGFRLVQPSLGRLMRAKEYVGHDHAAMGACRQGDGLDRLSAPENQHRERREPRACQRRAAEHRGRCGRCVFQQACRRNGVAACRWTWPVRKLDKPARGGFHWLAAREEQSGAVRVASTVYYFGERGRRIRLDMSHGRKSMS